MNFNFFLFFYLQKQGEVQKINYLTTTFSKHYLEINKEECDRLFECPVGELSHEGTVEMLANTIVFLNTLIHNPNVKASERPTFENFLKVLKGFDSNWERNREYYQNMYERIKLKEFKPDHDNMNVVFDLEQKFVYPKKTPMSFAVPFRRLICTVKLFEVVKLESQ